MRFGVSTFVTDEGIAPAELARALEDRGFDSVFLAEHTHIPASRESPWPGGADLPDKYYRTFDPFVTLAAMAAVTERLRLATGIALLVQRDPIITAKEVATLDVISGGRAALGVGAGWNREEMRDHGTDPVTRMALLRERVLAVKELWTKEKAEFHGEYVDFAPSYSWPKPVQRPHPPIYVGGAGPTTFDRVIEWGDAWLPIFGRREGLAGAISELNGRAAQAGRDRIPVAVFAVPRRVEALESVADAGVDEVLFDLPTAPADETLRRLDDLAALIAR
ncbi:MAG: TIGR03619 family F420-dependent LLM class oxidoreductase [Streptosporangiales bacterium]|nr:TIGR03619 family F420-dependent LLM class oxidoreductase [Streptosporangiales bacterium]